MKETLKLTIGKHDLSISYDREDMLKAIEDSRKEFEEYYFVRVYTQGNALSEKEYMENIDEMKKRLYELTEEDSLRELINKAPKKKNGTFHKKRVVLEEGCKNSFYLCEWHNSWIYDAFRVVAVTDTLLEMRYESVTETPA